MITHRSEKAIINVAEGDIFLDNGLIYQYYDRAIDVFTNAFLNTDSVFQSCTYKLPEISSALQKFLNRLPCAPDGISSNEMLASQSDCSIPIFLDEFKALCFIPLGVRIQGQSIPLQLAAPSLNFKKTKTAALFLRTIYQARPPAENSVRRASHDILRDE